MRNQLMTFFILPAIAFIATHYYVGWSINRPVQSKSPTKGAK